MEISKENIYKYLNSNMRKKLNRDKYTISTIAAKKLITNERVDIFIKYLYALSIINEDNNTFLESLYCEHIKAFNHFVEADSTGKVGKESFVSNFKNIIESIKRNGFDSNYCIPVSENLIPLDGAHRIAAAAALNLDVTVVNLELKDEKYNIDFFRSRGLNESLLDYITTQFAFFLPNSYMVLVWPRANAKDEEIRNILNRNGTIINRKNIRLSYNGLVNFQRIVYKREKWLGNYSNDFEGVHTKASQCYSTNGILRAFLFQSNADLIKMKDEIRVLYKVGKHAVHINDTHEETVEISQLVFNENANHFINCSVRKEQKVFNRLFEEYLHCIEQKKIDCKSVALIGGIIPLYGIRDAKDLDYISTKQIPESFNDNIELETKKLKYSSYSVQEIINNPKLHFVFKGVKFASLNVILEIKEKRNNDSDKRDVLYIRKLLKDGEIKYSLADYIKILLSISFYRRNIKIFLLKIRYYIYVILNKIK